MQMPNWSPEDLKVAFLIQKDLENPESGLSHFMQDLSVEREKVISKICGAKKETDSLMRYVGELKAISAALTRPHKIVEWASGEQDKLKNQSEVESVLTGGMV